MNRCDIFFNPIKLLILLDDAQRIIDLGGVYVNHGRVSNADTVLLPGLHILANNITLLRIGKSKIICCC